MTRGSDSTTAKSSTRPPMMAGPIARNFRFFSAASCAVSANRPPARRRSNATVDLGEFIQDLLREQVSAWKGARRRHECRRGKLKLAPHHRILPDRLRQSLDKGEWRRAEVTSGVRFFRS